MLQLYQSKCDMSYLSYVVVGQMKRHRQDVCLDIMWTVHLHQQTQLTTLDNTITLITFFFKKLELNNRTGND